MSDMIEEIDDERILQGLTIKELTERAGVERHIIARWRRGQYKPTLATLEALADALGCDIVLARRK